VDEDAQADEVFSVCGLPEVPLRRVSDGQYQAELIGLFLDTDYNALCLHVSQAFPPRAGHRRRRADASMRP
jgi:hypothetical protein